MSAPDLCRGETARAVARRFQVRPQHGLGQNFLVDAGVREAILDRLPEGPQELLEVGPGLGALSQGLLARGRSVVGVEIDPHCVAALGLLRAQYPLFRVLEGDILELDPARLGLGPGYLVVGNLPYQITGALLPRLLAWRPGPQRCLLLLQREVAQRLAAGPGDWSLATLALRLVADVDLGVEVPPACFWPAPKVHSALLEVRPREEVDRDLTERLLELARPLFQQRRKQLGHGLARSLGLTPKAAAALLVAAEIEPARRPGTLTPQEWLRLWRRVGSE